MMRRTIFIGMLVMGLLLTGCSYIKGGGSSKKGGDHDFTISFYDRGVIPKDAGSPEDNTWSKWIIENSGVKPKYEIIPRWESLSKFNVLLASGDEPDVIQEYSGEFKEDLYRDKQIIPVDDMIEEHSTFYKELLEKYPALRTAGTKSDGKLYEFGNIKEMSPFGTLFVRKDWLDKFDLKVPETIEELNHVIQVFSEEDPNESGEDDTYGLAIWEGQIIDQMFQNVNWVLEDGKVIKDWDRLQAATEFKKNLYDNGYIYKDFLTDNNNEKQKQLFLQGKVGVVTGRINTMADYQFYKSFRDNNPEAELIPIAFPETEFGQFSPLAENPIQMTTVVTSEAENFEAIMKYIDFMSSTSTTKALLYGFEDEHYEESEDGCPVIIDEEKFENDVSWTIDYQMISAKIELGECASLKNQLDPDVPVQKEFIDILEKAEELYITPERPLPWISHREHMPLFPKELNTINSSVWDAMNEKITKAIVSGNSYSVEQAIDEAKADWMKGDGDQLEDWMEEWYEENKDDALLLDDFYEQFTN